MPSFRGLGFMAFPPTLMYFLSAPTYLESMKIRVVVIIRTTTDMTPAAGQSLSPDLMEISYR